MLKKDLLKEIKRTIDIITENDKKMLKLKIDGKLDHNTYHWGLYEIRRYTGFCLKANIGFKKAKLEDMYINLKKYVKQQEAIMNGN